VNGPDLAPRNPAKTFAAILEGTALDVLEIDAASNRGIGRDSRPCATR